MDNKTLLEELDYYVVGHQEAKKALISLVTRSRLRQYQKYIKGMDEDYLLKPMKVLLLGASGCGKTHLIESLQKITHFPLIRVDATHLGPSGSGSGNIKPNDLKKMVMDQASLSYDLFPNRYMNIDCAVDRTIIFVDEIDKLGVSFDSSGNWNNHVQSNFLTLFDNKTEFSGISFIFAGAFTDITKDKEVKKQIGFNLDGTKEDESILDDQIVQAGLLPELVGRMTHIVGLDRFTKDDYTYILKDRLLPKKKIDMAAYGVFELNITDEQIDDLVDKAVKSNQGVRFLQRGLDRLFLEAEFQAGVNYTMYNEY